MSWGSTPSGGSGQLVRGSTTSGGKGQLVRGSTTSGGKGRGSSRWVGAVQWQVGRGSTEAGG